MTRRYFVPELAVAGLISLSTEEAQHAIRVMRVQVDDHVTLFDGRGHQCEATVVGIGRNECQCVAGDVTAVDREPDCEVHLGIALPKPDRARELIERLTELGVTSVTPIMAARTQRGPSESVLEKLRRGVIEACKQSGRNRLMTVHEPVNASEFFASNVLGSDSGASVCIIAHPTPSSVSLAKFHGRPSVTAAIGPEGGWTDEEVAMATGAGYQSVDLGKRVYRIETAAAVIAVVLTL
jgi:16S rRNA (uracil1498-N3)-methyltransferase